MMMLLKQFNGLRRLSAAALNDLPDGISAAQVSKMIDAAFAAKENSHSPYSNFRVGSSVLTGSGNVYAGTNVENASFGLTLCAERIALGNAVTHGHADDVVAVLCCTDVENDYKWACGACCSSILEHSETIPFFSVKPDRSFRWKRIREMVPFAFSKATLDEAAAEKENLEKSS
jgi:cytidine deaminase